MTELSHTPVNYSHEAFRADLVRLGLEPYDIDSAVQGAIALATAADAPLGDMRVVVLSTIVAYKLNQDPEDLLDEEPEYHFVAAVRASLPAMDTAGMKTVGEAVSQGLSDGLELSGKYLYDEKMPDDDGGARFLTAPEPLTAKDLHEAKMKMEER